MFQAAIVIVLAVVVINAIILALTLLKFQLPTILGTSIIWLLAQLNYFNGILDIQTLYQCISTLITFYVLLYTVKLLLLAYKFIPYIGKDIQISSKKSAVSTRRS